MKWKTFDNSVHTFFPFWMTHAVEKCHTSLGFPLQALLHWRAFKRGHIAPLLLALSPGFVLVYSLSTCDRAFMCVCQTRWGRWPPSIRQVQRSDLRWPNSEGYRRSRHVIVSETRMPFKFPAAVCHDNTGGKSAAGADSGAKPGLGFPLICWN